MASADAIEVNGIYYNLISKAREAEVTASRKNSADLVIPEYVSYEEKEYRVTRIAGAAFYAREDLTSIHIPSSIKSIGLSAFSKCEKLKSVIITDLSAWCNVEFESDSSNPLQYAHKLILNDNPIKDLVIPEDVTTIKNYTFYCCSNLTSVTFHPNVSSVGVSAFTGCDGLESVHITDLEAWCKMSFQDSCNPLIYAHNLYLGNNLLKDVTIPDGLSKIEDYCFSGCSSIKSVILPDGIETIGKEAFKRCDGLTTIAIPNSVVFIEDRAFFECSNLISIPIENNISNIGAYAFSNCYSLKTLSLPNGFSIDRGAFWYCSNITTLYLGSYINKIDFSAFSNCKELTDVYCYAKQVPKKVNESAFSDSYIELATLHVPSGSMDAYKSASPWKNFGTIVEMPTAKYIISYYIDGVLYKTYEMEEGETITPEAIPTKEGYLFSGWSDTPSMMPAKDVTVTGTFTINKYKIVYMVDDENYKSNEVEYGATITPEANPSKEGYTFSGWSDIPETMPANDVTVTGSFTINKYNLTYKVDDENYKSSEVDYSAAITPEAEPTKEGYTFSGWSEIPETMPANDVTVTGSFTITKYNLTYKVDDENYKSIEVEYGATITPEAEPTKEGYTFSGWSEIPETMPANDVAVTGTFSLSPLAIKADDQTRAYGEDNPAWTYTVTSGEVYGNGKPVLSCGATPTSPVGTYDITIEKGTVENPATLTNGTLTVTKALLTITAKSYSIKQGEPLPTTYEITYSGFKNGETKSVLSQQPTVTCSATAASEPGRYDIIVSGATADNYEITYVKGTLRIRSLVAEPGDLNGDGEVDVTDVVELIDMVLAGIYDPAGDINGDGEVDVTDVVELIDMVLSGE